MNRIIQTKPGDHYFHLFQHFREEIYSPDVLRFNQEETIDESILHGCYLLLKDDAVCARAALYNNPNLYYNDKRAFCIGHYESVNDEEVSSQLLSYISDEVKQSGGDYLIGPMNGSTWNRYRFSLHHDHPNFFLEPYHHLYYNEQFLQAGFHAIARYFSSLDTSLAYDHPDVLKAEARFGREGVLFRNIDVNRYEEELEKIYRFSSLAFKTNFLYTDIPAETFISKYAQMKAFIEPRFIIIAEDEAQETIGYIFCINDLLNTTQKSLIVKTAARHPDEKWRGLGHVLGNLVYRQAAEMKYNSAIHAFIYDGGTSINMSKDFYGNVYKRYALYGKEI